MDAFIESVCRQYPHLTLGVNKGGRHWTSVVGCRGRLWMIARRRGYFMQTTGQVGTLLDPEIKKFCGPGETDEKGYFWWKLVSARDIDKAIGLVAEL